jgi:hypothetical protein
MTLFRPALAALAATLLAGCVSQGPFPSLAPRPAEMEDWSEEPVRPVPVVADDIELGRRIAALLAEAQAGNRAFTAEAPAAERAAARAGGRGSDSWLEAQQAISRLEAARGATGAALAELHALDLARASAPTSEADQAALKAAIDEAEAVSARQQQRIDRISR